MGMFEKGSLLAIITDQETYPSLTCMTEDAGLEIRDMIVHLSGVNAVLCRIPSREKYVDLAARGIGCLNIDSARTAPTESYMAVPTKVSRVGKMFAYKGGTSFNPHPLGSFPANVMGHMGKNAEMFNQIPIEEFLEKLLIIPGGRLWRG